ncbi:MAG: hypothetical protein H6671_08945 [Anaerolineaceae bacterium]|nr:hypothetical protein [Anaerolineaceae bacterium]
MTYQEKTTTVSLMSTLLIFGFYLVNALPLMQSEPMNSTAIFSLWATIIVLSIIVNIVSSILALIVFNVIQMIRTHEEESDIMDERDKLIGLKGTRNSYVTFSLGVLVSMVTLVMNMPAVVMFNLLVISGLAAQVVGDVSRLYLYRRGV